MPGSTDVAVAPGVPPASRRLLAIEVARGLASAWVLLFHSLAPLSEDVLHPFLRFILPLTSFGWLGVHVFFAISGWCIVERTATAYHRNESTGAYLRERALRIYPSYLAALALAVLLLLAAAPFNSIPLSRNIPSSLGEWFVEVSLLQPAFGHGAILVVSWTLFYELTFYASSAVALVLRHWRVPANVLLVSGGAICLLVVWLPPAGILSGFGYWLHFFAGVLAWWTWNRMINLPWIVACLAATVAFALHFTLGTVIAGITAILLTIAARHPISPSSGMVRRLAVLGAASYSLYLIHVPVISPFFNLAGRAVSPDSIVYVAVWFAGLGLAVTAALLFHRAVEAPLEHWRRHFSASRPPT